MIDLEHAKEMQIIKFWFDMRDLSMQKCKNDLSDKIDDMLFEYGKNLFYDNKDNVGKENEND